MKAYFGILDNGKLHYKILPGLKSNYPIYDHEVVSHLTSIKTLERFLDTDLESLHRAKQYVIDYVSSAFHTLGDMLLVRDMEYVRENLCYAEVASKALYEYEIAGNPISSVRYYKTATATAQLLK